MTTQPTAPAGGRPAIPAPKKPAIRRQRKWRDPARRPEGKGPFLTEHPLAKPRLKGSP